MPKSKIRNALLDFCARRYEEQARKYAPKVKRFCSGLEKQIGQKILVFKAGGIQYSTNIQNPEHRFAKEILLGRLITPGWAFKDAELTAKVNQVLFFDESQGWGTLKDNDGLDLSEFLDFFVKRQITTLKLPGYKQQLKQPAQKPNGAYVDIYENPLIPQKLLIGGHTEYDIPLFSPRASLRIGDALVDEYLNNQKLEIIKVRRTKAPMPAV